MDDDRCTDHHRGGDAAFVTAALREGGVIGADSAVAEVAHEPIGVGVGIVGQLARLQLRYEGQAEGAPGMVVLKMPSEYPENRAVGDHFNFYEREGRFYQQIGAKLNVRTPRCYWNHIDPDDRHVRAAARGPRRPHDDQPGRGRRPERAAAGARRAGARCTARGGPRPRSTASSGCPG